MKSLIEAKTFSEAAFSVGLRSSYSRIFVTIIFFMIMLGLASVSTQGQYFGRNKVQYESFDFKVLSTKNFDVYFYPIEEEAAIQAARLAERWYARLSRILNHELKGRQILILYSSSPHFQQTTAIPGIIGEGTGGVTEMLKRRIVLPLAPSLADSNHVIGHELVHAFQFDITSQDHPRYAGGAPSALRLPLWFIEGLAEYLSRGTVDTHTAMWMRDAVRKEKFPTIMELNSAKYFPYRYGHSLWAYLAGEYGDGIVGTIMKSVGKAGDYEAVLKKATGLSQEKLSENWLNSLRNRYTPIAERTRVSDVYGTELIGATEMNTLNVSPALSPDGTQIVFLSTRDLFSIDMYLADARTGEVKRKLIGTAVDPHFESLMFIKSSGSWDSQGKRFVFGAVSGGQPLLTILNIETEEKEKEISFPDMGEILNPTWSPDGRYVCFSALIGGFTDLFLYDLQEEKLNRITDDPYSDLHPAWSPDGDSIVFVTDRFSSDLNLLEIGNYEMALLDPNTGDMSKIVGFNNSKNTNPQWSPDSQSIYFLADQNGITNIYRKDMQSGSIYKVTDLYTGVSGITGLSPALSVAKDMGNLTYCLYQNDKYSIYKVETEDLRQLGGTDDGSIAALEAAVLPPRQGAQGELAGLLNNPLFGLPEEKDYDIRDYDPTLTLDYIAPPQLAVGVDRFGTYGGGGIAMFFSDILGYHSLVTALQISTRILDSSFLVGYEYSKYRWNIGAVAQRVPYVTGGYSEFLGEVDGEPAIVQQELIFRQINYRLSGIASYPFNQSFRFETALGYQFIRFDRDLNVNAFSLVTGREILDRNQDLESPDSLHLGTLTTALVYDSSFFGATSPILGQRYRLEATPRLGSLTNYEVLADYRRYFMPVRPFTLAFRFMHFGRYGPDAEDDRLYPLFVGYQSLVRGYNNNSFSAEECGREGDCEVFNRLFGSKMIVANAELRFPLLNVLGIGKGFYGILPIEFFAFADGGLAWFNENEAWFLGGERKPVYSAGVGLRMNLFGYAILGISYVHPFNRPKKDWYFQFLFTPGF